MRLYLLQRVYIADKYMTFGKAGEKNFKDTTGSIYVNRSVYSEKSHDFRISMERISSLIKLLHVEKWQKLLKILLCSKRK